MSTAQKPVDVPERLLDAAVKVIKRFGWDGLTIERLAAAAAVSRVTIWRQGINKEKVRGALLRRLYLHYRNAMWPAITSSGNARSRLERLIGGLCEVAEANLMLLGSSDALFHHASARRLPGDLGFSPAFARVVADGARDRSLRYYGDANRTGELLFNTVCYTYLHLRSRHRWPAPEIRRYLTSLILDGMASARSSSNVTARSVSGRGRR